MDDQPKSRPTSPVSSTPTSTVVKYHSTLKVDLPKFEGNPVNWKDFYSATHRERETSCRL